LYIVTDRTAKCGALEVGEW